MPVNRGVLTYAGAAALGVGWSLIAPNYWIFTVTSGIILGIAGLGLLAIVGWGREISLMQAGLTGTAAYLTGYFYRSTEGGWGLPFVAAVGLAILTVVALSVIISLATAKLSGIYIIVLTLAFQFLIERTVFVTRQLTGGISAFKTPRPALFGLNLESDKAFFYFTLVVAALLVAGMLRFRRSAFGRSLIFVGWDRKAAAASGIAPWRYKIFAFAVAGFCAGVAGALFAPLFRSPPLPLVFDSMNSLLYLSIPIVAGFESLLAVLIVAVGYDVVPQGLESLHISPFILAGLALAFGTLAGPRGATGALKAMLVKGRKLFRQEPKEIVLDDVADSDSEARRANLEVLEAYMPHRDKGSSHALACSGISLAFGGLKALDDVELTVPSHQLVGLIGPNGAGKTTLLDVLNGLTNPDRGTIESFGVDITRQPAWGRAELGMSRTFQANRIVPDLTVGENLLMGASKLIKASVIGSVVGSPKARSEEARAQQAAWAAAQLLDLDRWWGELAGELDFGAQRRVEIGRTLLSGPRLLLLDEPAAGLDSEEADHLFDLIKRLKADLGLTVVLIEHYVQAVLNHADLIYVLDSGKVLAAGDPAAIASDPQVRAAYLGSIDYAPMGEHV